MYVLMYHKQKFKIEFIDKGQLKMETNTYVFNIISKLGMNKKVGA